MDKKKSIHGGERINLLHRREIIKKKIDINLKFETTLYFLIPSISLKSCITFHIKKYFIRCSGLLQFYRSNMVFTNL